MAQESRMLRVGAVQMVSENGNIEGNLERATPMVEEAAARGAELVVLPEFMPTGYIYAKQIWDAGEPGKGPTARWLEETSSRLGIWLGTSYLEAEGEDFLNTFSLVSPGGSEAGRVRKQTPAIAEAYFTRGEAGPHIIDTDFGRMGVGICYENQLAYMPEKMVEGSADIMVMPHSAPSPMPNPLFPTGSVERFNANLRKLASVYAEMLGIPVIFVNKSGEWHSPMPGLPFLTQHSSFPGLTAIVDSDGTLKAQLGSEEGVIVEDVILDSTRKTGRAPARRGHWAMPEPWLMNIWRVVEAIGGLYYRSSGQRRRRAREISSRG